MSQRKNDLVAFAECLAGRLIVWGRPLKATRLTVAMRLRLGALLALGYLMSVVIYRVATGDSLPDVIFAQLIGAGVSFFTGQTAPYLLFALTLVLAAGLLFLAVFVSTALEALLLAVEGAFRALAFALSVGFGIMMMALIYHAASWAFALPWLTIALWSIVAIAVLTGIGAVLNALCGDPAPVSTPSRSPSPQARKRAVPPAPAPQEASAPRILPPVPAVSPLSPGLRGRVALLTI
ncbi:hypothetical protein M4578_11335 [Salipiger sp. P9]|uniref:hypothetical protein n=1 Tax=Salipiger pentaromativorans TaxID=2943193 RepID=UPI0021580BD6|nr:hypothetical protein [Salipiger pentaromativorans]MCR8548426.1 hypothetical protein [Salipiger pentaromativorans]